MSVAAPFNLDRKRVLLIGATGVLGRAHAEALIAAGARVVLADLASTDVVDFAGGLGTDCRVEVVDVTDEASVRACVRAAARVWDGLDGVVSNAALTGERLLAAGDTFASFEDSSVESWRRVLDVNLTGSYLAAREGGRALKASGGGSMVLVSSIYGVLGPDHRIYNDQPFKSFASYSASKAGVIGLTRWLATWWGDVGIRVNCLVPGGVFNGHSAEFSASYGNRVPLGRMADRREVSGGLLYLLSDAASYVTGQVLNVDGGMTAW